MTSPTSQPALYRRTVARLGLTLLIFLLLFDGLGLAQIPLQRAVSAWLFGSSRTVILELCDMIAYLLSFMLPVLFYRLITPRDERPPLPLSPALPRRVWMIVPAAVAVIYCAAQANAYLLGLLGLAGGSYASPDASLRPYEAVLSYMAHALVPAFCEELLFRGVVLGALRPYGKTVAVVGSALLFGLMHQTADQLLYATVAGVILALVTLRTGSVWTAVMVHGFNNLLSVVDQVLWNRLSYQLEMVLYSVLEVAVVGSGLVCLALLILRSKRAGEDDALACGPEVPGALKGAMVPSMVLFGLLSVVQIVWRFWM